MSRELETFLQQYPDLVLVNFWQEGCDASRYMAQMLAGLEHFQQVSVLHLKLAEHRPCRRVKCCPRGRGPQPAQRGGPDQDHD